MAAILFDGRFFALSLDDGRRVLLLDAMDNASNASCRSLLQEQHEGFGQKTGQEAPLVPRIVERMQAAAAGLSSVGDFAAAVMLLKDVLAVPRAVRLLFVGASLGSSSLRLAASILSEAVPRPIPGAPPLASLSVTAAAPLADAAAVTDIPDGVIPIRTDLSRLPLPQEAFDLLLFDARGLVQAGEDFLQQAVERALSALVPQGFAVLLGPPSLGKVLGRAGFPIAPETSLFLSAGRGRTIVSDGGAEIRREGMHLGRLLQSYLAGEADTLAALAGVRRYRDVLTAHPADVPWRAERAAAAQAMEVLVELRLGQEDATSSSARSRLSHLAERFSQKK